MPGEAPVQGVWARRMSWLLLLTWLLPLNVAAEARCAGYPLALQVLGSGGPVADDNRASSGYLLWHNGRSRLLVDAGSGVFTRFGEAGASFAELDLLALSHFHTDHAASLPALLKSGYFSRRRRALAIAGPDGAGPFPSLDQFLHRLLDRREGAFAYLAGYLTGSDGLVKLNPVTVDLAASDPTMVYDAAGLRVEALPVPHGIVPALAYRVTVAERTLVFGSDQNGSSEAFLDLARDADLLVLHAAIPEGAGRAARSLHAVPSRLAEIVQEAKPSTVVISHWMARSLRHKDAIVASIAERYAGNLAVAQDLDCFPLLAQSQQDGDSDVP
ncbi:MAG: MBL fold metallo-hydrolase [Pseudomonadota bacterium]